MQKFFLSIGFLGVLFVSSSALAQSPSGYEDVRARYTEVVTTDPIAVSVPTVVAVPTNSLPRWVTDFAVYDVTDEQFVASQYVERSEVSESDIRSAITAVPTTANAAAMIDGYTQTFTDFPIQSQSEQTIELELRTTEPVAASGIRFDFAPFVAYPLTVKIDAETATGWTTVVQTKRFTTPTERFPEVTATNFRITLTHIQPVRLSELRIMTPDDTTRTTQNAVRFLAQPDHQYEIYAHPDALPGDIVTPEAANLALDEGVLALSSYSFVPNSFFVPSDGDSDGVPDEVDNCVQHANADQVDINENGRGDVCDDFDRDGVLNYQDNCVNEPNRRQADADGDGIGDVCDEAESRFTEANPWVPWVAIGMAMLVLLVLFAIIAIKPKTSTDTDK